MFPICAASTSLNLMVSPVAVFFAVTMPVFLSTVVTLQQGVPALTSGGTETAIDAPRISAIPDIDIHVFIVLFFMTSSSMDGH
jgi:hypothetical protein